MDFLANTCELLIGVVLSFQPISLKGINQASINWRHSLQKDLSV